MSITEEIDRLALHYGWTLREKQRVQDLAKQVAEQSYDAGFNYDLFLGGGGKEYATKEQFINQLFNDTP